MAGFDTLGDTAVIELKGNRKNAKKIALGVLKRNKNIKSVYIKAGAHTGKARAEPVEWAAGEKRNRVFVKEWGCIFRVSLGKVFYSPRLGTERRRICGKIRDGEKIGVFFAGVGPYAIVFAKHSQAKKITAFEWSRTAFRDMEWNIEKNKVGERVEGVLGDVEKKVRHYKGKFTRIVMPSPHTAKKYFASALWALRKGGTVHYYAITEAGDAKKEIRELRSIAKECKRKLRVLEHKKARPYSKQLEQRAFDIRAE